ncbi:4-oxalocrotonate tautomerase [Luteibacter sp. UNC138MFCol5.1]|uniref:2-hydroxymuconate tautomerase n=1 Tax=Luteibacter sp. UNC138MFCol5.1 TaxID=1502774 RepID=UPI0008D2CDB4|nr:2-hydroxymuconate tautomerase [Luteibacter sp. UNC138MFCol5.1]SEO90723.1 4-oxalocrotonate tautomerase [Luteibacter sp. UNC138MFCol5.1]
MPIVTVQMLEGRSDAQKEALIADLHDAVVRHLGVADQAVTIVLQESEAANWAVGGKSIRQLRGG